ncbi:MAG: hypothetical protein OXC70_05130 [Gammaproteobacteria bacterium]|nr:hypothetical protein [Gammaproteobacteria bacterium]
METCFVIQPFDDDRFDQRFEDTFRPALVAAHLNAYRVDRDASVDVTIQAIETGISNAAICLADITTNNPNVWFELGYAYAKNQPVILICSDEREGSFPFDIQHRAILRYKTKSLSDFARLGEEITRRAKAKLTSALSIKQVAAAESTAPMEGLSQIEIMVLAAVAGNTAVPGSTCYLYELEQQIHRAGLTSIAFGLALRRLQNKSFVELKTIIGDSFDESNEPNGVQITREGWDWIEANESYFQLRTTSDTEIEDLDDEVPF